MVSVYNKPGNPTLLTGNQIIVSQFDITPRINYDPNGRAISIREFSVWNGIDLIVSEYGVDNAGNYTEFHMDPEHGGQPTRIVPKSRLEKLDASNTNGIQMLKVLGEPRAMVERALLDNNNSAYHFDSLESA